MRTSAEIHKEWCDLMVARASNRKSPVVSAKPRKQLGLILSHESKATLARKMAALF